MEEKDKNFKIQATCKFPEVKSTMRFGTTFIFIGQPVDVVALKEKINYQSTDVADRPVIRVPNNSEAYDTVRHALEEAHAEYTTREWVEYTKKEIENAPYYELRLPYPFQSQDKFWAEDFGVEYSYSCNHCRKTSAIIEQTSPMKLDLKKPAKWQMFIVPPEFVVREDVKQIIEQEGLAGVQFSKVIDYKNRDIESHYYQMHIDHVLPPMNEYTIKTDGGYLPCKVCGRTATHIMNPMSYTWKDFEGAKDFNLSQEHLFNFATQVLIVSKRVRDILKSSVRRCNPVPVLLVDCLTQGMVL